jgi:ParB-like chromosome segregation protein Spo0J
MIQIVMKPKNWPKPPRYGRATIDRALLQHLADSLEAIGFINPIECLPDGETVSGDRRRQAALLKESITEVPVRIISDPLKAMALRIRRVSENLQREDLTLWDKYQECKGFMEDQPGITGKEIAAAINVDASTIPRYLCLDHCIAEVRQAAKDGLIGMKATYEISKEPLERQQALLAEALAGGAAQVARARKRRNGSVPAVRTARIRIPLATDTARGIVTIAGDEIDLEDGENILKEAMKAVRAAREKGLNASTAQKVWKDVAAAGA